MKKFVEILARMLTKNITIVIIKEYKKDFKSHSDTYKEEFNKTMDIKTLSNFLIQKFWKLRIKGQRLECTRTKIGKLLTIIQILSIKNNNQLAFDDDIMEETCGTSVPVLSVYRYPYDIWELYSPKSTDNTFFEQSARINLLDTIEVEDSIPELYMIREEVTDLYKKIVNDVFVEFGTYNGYEIGKLINQFKTDICDNGVVRREKVANWLNSIDVHNNNPIITFIHNYNFNSR